jgi:hypothetical protein
MSPLTMRARPTKRKIRARATRTVITIPRARILRMRAARSTVSERTRSVADSSMSGIRWEKSSTMARG